jgi:surfeit locus 1 family protein
VSAGSSSRRWIVLAAAVASVALTLRLASWQLDRAAQKIALQQAIDARAALPPLGADALARTPADALAQQHRRAEVRGHWLAAHTVWLDNRPLDGRAGFLVVTPLALGDGAALLAQRGWQPRDFLDRTRVVLPPTPTEPVQLAGRLALEPSRLVSLGEEAAGPIRQNLDLDAFARETGLQLLPIVLLQEEPAGDDALRRDGPRPAAGVHTHYGYAFQWAALAVLIAGLYVWFQIFRPLRRA